MLPILPIGAYPLLYCLSTAYIAYNAYRCLSATYIAYPLPMLLMMPIGAYPLPIDNKKSGNETFR